jgi:hypothetical protein
MRWISAILLATFSLMSYAQGNSDSLVKYTVEFKFTDGIFPDFESVKHNNPIPKSRIISELNYDDNDFFNNLLIQKQVRYFDMLGNSLELPTKTIWGYAQNGFIYIKIDDGFNRITLVGSICHVVAYHTYESYNNYSPYTNYGYNSYYPNQSTSTTEMRQYLFDFQNGRIVPYDSDGLEVLLMADPTLYDEYMQLSSKKKEQMRFIYVRKFNDRNPLYLIKNKK